jgi:hypothetical protein
MPMAKIKKVEKVEEVLPIEPTAREKILMARKKNLQRKRRQKLPSVLR